MTAPRLRLDPRLAELEPSATLTINERSRRLQEQGRQVVRLGLGQSPFPVPEVVVAALRRHAHEKDYLPTRGLPALRRAVAAYLGRRHGLAFDAENVLIGPGSKELLFLIQLAAGRELLIPAPSWVSYAPQARILGHAVTWLPADFSSGLGVTPERLEAACAVDPGRPRLLILNYPNNPTGTSYGERQLRGIAEVARHHGVLVIADEIYAELTFAADHVSIARFYPEGTIVSGGLSKWCGAGGWRLGTCAFPPELGHLADAVAALASETFTAVSAPIQHAAVRAFEGGPEIDDYLARSRALLDGLLSHGARALRQAGAEVCEPRGGFYLFPRFEAHRRALEGLGLASGPALCEHLLEAIGVACLPGSAFGRPPDELSLRLALVDFDGAAALANLPAAGAGGYRVDEAWLTRWCAPTMSGLRALDEFFGTLPRS